MATFASPAEGGKRDDQALTRSVSLKGQEFKVSFEGLARACAGGVGVDGVHSFTLTGTAKKVDGNIAPSTQFKLAFDGNKGHDYSGDDPSIQPAGWTPDQIKKAKFVTTDASGNQKRVEEMNVTTDANGKFSVTVLSSDIVSSDIKVKVKWTNPSGVDSDAGQQTCDFAEAVSIRRFVNQFDPTELFPDEDTGWLFDFPELDATGAETPAKVYMKFMVDPSKGDVDGNWKFVNGHRMSLNVASVDLNPDVSTQASNNLDDYAIVVNPDNPQASSRIVTTAIDGAAQATLRAGTRVVETRKIYLDAYDLSQWDQ